MKALLKLFFLAALTGLLAGCSNDDLTSSDEVQLKSAQPHLVTLPFKADLVNTFMEETGPNPILTYPHS